MRNGSIISALFILLTSCGNSTNNNESTSPGSDTVGLTNPVTIDTTKHPSGVDNSSVISTDTAAINIQNTFKKADSISKQNNKK